MYVEQYVAGRNVMCDKHVAQLRAKYFARGHHICPERSENETDALEQKVALKAVRQPIHIVLWRVRIAAGTLSNLIDKSPQETALL